MDIYAEERGTTVDEGLHGDLVAIVRENSSKVSQMYEEGTFQRVFWEQQERSAQVKSSNSIRWDPLMIRWCLYISGSAYELLRQSGVIVLPSQRTLRDYTYYTKATVGF